MILSNDDTQSINKWVKTFEDNNNKNIGLIVSCSPDFQHNNQVAILSKQQERYCFNITQNNLIQFSIYFAVRKVIDADWLNDRDQFLYPTANWQTDLEFQNDCFAYTLFSNNIQSKYGTNYWLPFTEHEVNSREKFASNFMTDFINGKIKSEKSGNELFDAPVGAYCIRHDDDCTNDEISTNRAYATPLQFSPAALSVFDTGRNLWQYYHAQPKCNVNASLYDIREHFQGRNDKGKMNNKSTNATYNELIANLRSALKTLAKKIEPKVYEYGFLKG